MRGLGVLGGLVSLHSWRLFSLNRGYFCWQFPSVNTLRIFFPGSRCFCYETTMIWICFSYAWDNISPAVFRIFPLAFSFESSYDMCWYRFPCIYPAQGSHSFLNMCFYVPVKFGLFSDVIRLCFYAYSLSRIQMTQVLDFQVYVPMACSVFKPVSSSLLFRWGSLSLISQVAATFTSSLLSCWDINRASYFSFSIFQF